MDNAKDMGFRFSNPVEIRRLLEDVLGVARKQYINVTKKG